MKAQRFKVKRLTRRARPRSLPQIVAELREVLLGSGAYFGPVEVSSTLKDLGAWTRRRLQCYA